METVTIKGKKHTFEKIIVQLEPNKNYTKSVLKFYGKNGNTYKEVTKFQAKKSLTRSQIENLQVYEKAKQLIEGNFNKLVEFNIKRNKNPEDKDLLKISIMIQAIKDPYSYPGSLGLD